MFRQLVQLLFSLIRQKYGIKILICTSCNVNNVNIMINFSVDTTKSYRLR